MIYKMVFSNTIVRVRPHPARCYRYPPGKHGGRALPHVCRQLHLETQNMLLSFAKFDIHGHNIESFVNYMGTVKAALIGSVIAYRSNHHSPEHSGSRELLGKLKALKRAHLVGSDDLADLKDTRLGFALDWATGGLLHTEDLNITTSRFGTISKRRR